MKTTQFFSFFILFLGVLTLGTTACGGDDPKPDETDVTTVEDEMLIMNYADQEIVFTNALNVVESLKSVPSQTSNFMTGVGPMVNGEVLSVSLTISHTDSSPGEYILDSTNKISLSEIKSYSLPRLISETGTLTITAYDTHYAGEFSGTFLDKETEQTSYELSGKFRMEL